MTEPCCPTPEQLGQFLEGGLSPEMEKAIAAHLDDHKCGSCLQELERGLPKTSPRANALPAAAPGCQWPEEHEFLEWLKQRSPASAPERIDELPADALFAKYRVCRLLSETEMARVYEVLDTETNQLRALKTPAHLDPYLEALFQREIVVGRILGDAPHPDRFVLPEDCGRVERIPFLTMRLVPHVTLRRALEHVKWLPHRRVANYFRRIAAALHEVHQFGIVHRDLKPGNIFIEYDGKGDDAPPLIADFGLAKLVRTCVPAEAPVAGTTAAKDVWDLHELTRTGDLQGTLLYMSPEQLRGEKEVGPASDLYSLGLMMVECLTGHRPYRTGRRQSLDPNPQAWDVVHTLPVEWRTLLSQCLRTDPAERLQTAENLACELAKLESLTKTWSPAIPAHTPAPKTNSPAHATAPPAKAPPSPPPPQSAMRRHEMKEYIKAGLVGAVVGLFGGVPAAVVFGLILGLSYSGSDPWGHHRRGVAEITVLMWLGATPIGMLCALGLCFWKTRMDRTWPHFWWTDYAGAIFSIWIIGLVLGAVGSVLGNAIEWLFIVGPTFHMAIYSCLFLLGMTGCAGWGVHVWRSQM
ncbi:MAG: protein kinase [Gemmataceae bacterium]|nr:protein kinase [Gemmataceae bacterium]